MLLNNTLLRKANWIGNILRRNHLLHDANEGQMAGESSKKNRLP